VSTDVSLAQLGLLEPAVLLTQGRDGLDLDQLIAVPEHADSERGRPRIRRRGRPRSRGRRPAGTPAWVSCDCVLLALWGRCLDDLARYRPASRSLPSNGFQESDRSPPSSCWPAAPLTPTSCHPTSAATRTRRTGGVPRHT